MARVPWRLIAVVLSALVLSAPLWQVADQVVAASDPVPVIGHVADYLVLDSGRLIAKETLTVDVPEGRRDLTRVWDVTDPADRTARLVPHGVRATLDGRALGVELSWREGRRYRVAHIGSPTTALPPGRHDVSITYQVHGVLATTDSGSALTWQVVPSTWRHTTGSSLSRLTLPEPATAVQCHRDDAGSCDVVPGPDGHVEVRTGALPDHTAVTVHAELATPAPERSSVPWPVMLDGVLGRTPWIAALLASAAGAVAIAGTIVVRGQPSGRWRRWALLATVVAVAVLLTLVQPPATVHALPLLTLAVILIPPRERLLHP